MTTILIVEDDPAMTVALRDGFEFEKYTVDMANDGEQAMRMTTRGRYDVIILDVMLPKKSGFDICKELREKGNDTPVIMLTARGQEIDKIVGLKLGADDYVTKPFSFIELLARVEAVMRRAHRKKAADQVQFGQVKLDFRTYQATKAEQPLELTPREFSILRYFLDHPNEVVSRETLLNHVWGYSHNGYEHTVNSHINRLRAKIEANPDAPEFVLTVWGVGYKFEKDP